jgi:UDP-N-acetylmuramoylalanine--D-glutamate ligase
MELDGKKVVVMGLGEKSGPALARFLSARGAVVTVSDSADAGQLANRLSELPDGVNHECGGHKQETLRWADLIVLSPGVPTTLPVLAEAKQNGKEIIAEVELAFRFLEGKMIGVTGTKGKSTTCTLLHHILSQSGRDALLGGNIGTPLIELVDAAKPDSLVVAELSSFQLATIQQLRPWIAVVLNVFADHLDRYADQDEYRADKLRLVENQQAEDHLVLYRQINSGDDFSKSRAGQHYYFDTSEGDFQGCFPRQGELIFRQGKKEKSMASLEQVGLKGEHNLLNVLAALTVAGIVGVDPDSVGKSLRSFEPLPHRLELVGEVNGVSYYDDSQGTNPAALGAALDTLAPPLILIAGGRYKGGDFSELRSALSNKVRAALLIGEAAERIALAWEGATQIERHTGLETAVPRAAELAGGQGSVLLSPACSSLDMFDNYRQRGRMFNQQVKQLAGAR